MSLAGAGFIFVGATSDPVVRRPRAAGLRGTRTIGDEWLAVPPRVPSILLCVHATTVAALAREQWRAAVVLGVTVAFMNVCFYQAIARIPLGSAVTIEFLGPFSVAVLGRRIVAPLRVSRSWPRWASCSRRTRAGE